MSSPTPAVGDPAPPFALACRPREVADVGALVGREPILLLFIPLAFSPVCTDELCHLRDTWSRWSGLGARVFAISVDSPFVVDRFREEAGVPFPVLSDFNKEVSARYGALHEDLFGLRGVSKRAAFVIGRDGRIAYAWISEDPSRQVPFDEVAAALAAA